MAIRGSSLAGAVIPLAGPAGVPGATTIAGLTDASADLKALNTTKVGQRTALGVDQINNTADKDKPVSTAQAAAIAATPALTVPAVAGGIARTWLDRFGDVVCAHDYSDGSGSGSNDTLALSAAISAAVARARPVLLTRPFGTTQPLVLGDYGKLIGQGVDTTKITALGNFEAIVNVLGVEARVERVALDQTGTTTAAMILKPGAVAPKLIDVGYKGDRAGPLVYSVSAGVAEFHNNKWDLGAATTSSAQFDAYNQNVRILGGRTGGLGSGFSITNTGAVAARLEGFMCQAHLFLNAGYQALVGGQAFIVWFVDCMMDQSKNFNLIVRDGATGVYVGGPGSYIGQADGSSGGGISVEKTAGGLHCFSPRHIYGGANGIVVAADGTYRISGITIEGVTLNGQSGSGMLLDSVGCCRILNVETASGCASGTLNTKGTHPSKGQYTLIGRHAWIAPALWDTNSRYDFGAEQAFSKKYANDSAAASGGVMVGEPYFNTTSSALTFRQS